MNDVLNKVLRAETCAGCGLCQSITGGSVQVELSDSGYFRPIIGTKVSQEHSTIIRKTCPAISVQHPTNTVNLDPIWGPVLRVEIGHAKNEKIRYQGSSGGVLTALQIHLLKTGKVDAVISVGASKEEPLLNQIYVCRTEEEVLSNSGSRYAPSAPLREIHRLVEGLDSVAFVGKPCDVSALRRLTTVDPLLSSKEFYFLSFLCAGVPSQNATTELVEALGYQPEQITKFRYRGEGWPGFAKADAKDGTSAQMSYNDSWGKILNRHLQTRCKICPDGTGEFADITCGDAWHGDEKGFPDFREMDGRSAILVRSKRGLAVLESAVKNGDIEVEAEGGCLSDLSKMQPYQVNRRQMLFSRTCAYILFKHHFVGFTLKPAIRAALMVSLPRIMRDFYGTIKRLIKGKM